MTAAAMEWGAWIIEHKLPAVMFAVLLIVLLAIEAWRPPR